MTVKVRERKYPNGKMHYEADIHVRLLDGTIHRERRRAPAQSRQGALRWAKEREAWLVRHGTQTAAMVGKEGHGHDKDTDNDKRDDRRDVPTLAKFADRFLADARANRQRPSTIQHKEIQLRAYILPVLGRLRLDEITEAEIARLKAEHTKLAASTLNNMLALLRLMLGTAKTWGVVSDIPEIKRVKTPPETTDFYTSDQYEQLVAAARAIGRHVEVMVLLGGDAGLRAGEMLALRWANVDLERRRLTVAENEWKGHLGPPKGGKVRHIVLTERLAGVLSELPRTTERVLWRLDTKGPEVTKRCLDGWLHRAQRAAGFPAKGPHILRHTFCTRLAACGAPSRAIQGLAGHASVRTTDRYMHLAPQVLESAIKLLDRSARASGASTERRIEPLNS
ncbi:MAG: site-specific integrase [Myxococcales bacterium]|nr:site-specific integrase [Myxococcales bacterium]MCB9706666.1 site-specific integrase [Myxococcales bacterium]